MKENIISRVMAEMGRKGGKRSLETMTPKERIERAKKAAAKSAEARQKRARS